MVKNINLFIAFGAGLLAFFSPCFLPLVPAYLIYITGLSLEEIKKARLVTVIHSLLFITGFTMVFVSLGIAASLLGQFFYEYRNILRMMGSGLVLILGLHLMRIIRFSFLDLERRLTFALRPFGYVGSIFIGMTFALAWSPCIGPILAGILVYAGLAENLGRGMLMLISFSLGLALPLFLVSLLLGRALVWVKRIVKYLAVIHFIAGIFLIMLGLLLAGNYLQTISSWLIDLTGYEGI